MSAFTANRQSLLHRAFCLLLCVSAWRGPVAMLHDHSALTNSDHREEHQQKFHASCCGDESLGLHWHFAFPADVNGKTLPVSEQVAPELAVFACVAAAQSVDCGDRQSVEVLNFDTQASFELVFCHQQQVDCVAASPASFLASLLCDAPLIAITGVSLV